MATTTLSETDVTGLLKAWSDGKSDALDKLMPRVFDELRRVARMHFARESVGHTLQPTALVNEVFLRLVDRRKVNWKNRAHFFGFAAQLMRRILVDHARCRKADKRGGSMPKTSLDEALSQAESREIDLVALDDALEDLSRIDPDGCRVVEMRFFAGLNYKEIAEVIGTSSSTVRRQWTTARLWLYRELTPE